MSARTIFLGLAAAVSVCGAACAAEVEMKLVNQGPDGPMAFDPPFVKIKPGDSVKFVAKDPGHNVESIKGMAPEGAKPFKGQFSKDETVTFDKAGVYGVKCSPHFSMGMAGLVAVGDTYPNLEAAKTVVSKASPPAKKRLEADFAKLAN